MACYLHHRQPLRHPLPLNWRRINIHAPVAVDTDKTLDTYASCAGRRARCVQIRARKQLNLKTIAEAEASTLDRLNLGSEWHQRVNGRTRCDRASQLSMTFVFVVSVIRPETTWAGQHAAQDGCTALRVDVPIT